MTLFASRVALHLSLSLLVCLSSIALAAPPVARVALTGIVVSIADGDTCTLLLPDKRTVIIRLANIDAPEKKQAFGSRAKETLAQLIFHQTVHVYSIGADRYGRVIGDVYLLDGTSVNAALVRQGMARLYRRYSQNPELAALEAAARQAQRGLWADAHPIPPWDFRKGARQESGTPNAP